MLIILILLPSMQAQRGTTRHYKGGLTNSSRSSHTANNTSDTNSTSTITQQVHSCKAPPGTTRHHEEAVDKLCN